MLNTEFLHQHLNLENLSMCPVAADYTSTFLRKKF